MKRKQCLCMIITILMCMCAGMAYADSAQGIRNAITKTEAGSTADVSWNGTLLVNEEMTVRGHVTIRNVRFERGSAYRGCYFNIQKGASLTLIDCTVDGGAEWSLNQSQVNAVLNAESKTDSAAYSKTSVKTDAMRYCVLKSGAITSNDRMFKVSGSLVLTNTTLQNYVGEPENAGTALGAIIVTGGSVRMDGSTQITGCFAYRFSGDDMGSVLRVDSGTAVIGGQTTITGNAGIGGNGAIIGIVDGEVTLQDQVQINRNLAVNSNGLIEASGYNGTVPKLVMNGGTLTGNLSIPGTSNNFGSMIYNRNGVFIMNSGSITENTGGFWPAFNMRYATQTQLNAGFIGNNTALIGSRSHELHLRGGASIGKNMTILGNLDVYGGSNRVVNTGSIQGNLYLRTNLDFVNQGFIEGEVETKAGCIVNADNGYVLLPETIFIAGTPSVGSTLTAYADGVTPAAVNMTFVWKRNGQEVGRGNTYTFQTEDLYATMTCEGYSSNGYRLAAVTFHTPVAAPSYTPPRTGDDAAPLLWCALMTLTGAILLTMLRRKHNA